MHVNVGCINPINTLKMYEWMFQKGIIADYLFTQSLPGTI